MDSGFLSLGPTILELHGVAHGGLNAGDWLEVGGPEEGAGGGASEANWDIDVVLLFLLLGNLELLGVGQLGQLLVGGVLIDLGIVGLLDLGVAQIVDRF